jgi:hypothetical protein
MKYYNLADKYSFGRNSGSRKVWWKERKKYLIPCMCRVCGKEFHVDSIYKNVDFICEDCRKALKKLDSEANKGR